MDALEFKRDCDHLVKGPRIVSTEFASQDVQKMAEEILELRKLSSLGAGKHEQKDEYDLGESEFLALDLLTKTESMNVGELQRGVGVLPAQMSRIIRSLEGKGDQPMVTCTLNPDDKRKIDVSITEAGRKAHQGYQKAKLASAMGILAGLDERDRNEFMRILRLIRTKIAEAADSSSK